jgi:hypothetical protein
MFRQWAHSVRDQPGTQREDRVKHFHIANGLAVDVACATGGTRVHKIAQSRLRLQRAIEYLLRDV